MIRILESNNKNNEEHHYGINFSLRTRNNNYNKNTIAKIIKNALDKSDMYVSGDIKIEFLE